MMMMTYQQVKELQNRVLNNNNHYEDAIDKGAKRARDFFDAELEEASDAVTMAETDDDEEIGGGEDEQQKCYESEEETQIAKAMARAAFTKSASSPMLNLLLKAAFQEEKAAASMGKRTRDAAALSSAVTMNSPRPPSLSSSTRSIKKARRGVRSTVTAGGDTTSPVRLSVSAPSLKCLDQKQPTTTSTTRTKPSEMLQSLLSEAGYTYKTYDYTTLTNTGFFVKLSSEQICLYDTNLVRAVRDQDLTALKSRRATVPSLHAGNKFGETILHACCRRAAYPIVQYLLTDGGHPVRVCCDYGRTVLHDAAWTCTPDFAVIDLLLNVCPDLLYVCDRRGYTALDYIPKDHYGPWCNYLAARTAASLRPTTLLP